MGKLRPFGPGGDLELASSLREAAEARSWHGELVLAATDSEGMADVMALATPTVPPMTRTPFANTVPDVVVTGPDSTWQGWGGMLAAAHLDHRWRAREELSWLA